MKRRVVWGMLCLACVLFTSAALAQDRPGRVYYDFGVFAYEDGDYEGAEANLQKALSFEPDNPYYNHFLGKTYLSQGRYEEAERHLTAAWAKDEAITGLRYDLALLYFKQGQYEKATPLFEAEAADDPANVMSRYYAGIGRLNQKQYDKALVHLNEASEKSPTIRPNGYYYAGICHLQLGQYGQAIEKLQYVRDNADSANLRQNAEKWLTASRSRQISDSRFRWSLKLGYQYDSNITLEPLDEDRPTDEEDFAYVGYATFKVDAVRSGDFTAGVGYNHYQIAYQDLREYDLFGAIGSVYARYRIDDVTLGMSYLPNYYVLDREGYLMKHQFRPDVLWRISTDLTARFGYNYEINKYLTDNDRTGHTHRFDGDLYHSFFDQRLQVFAGGGFDSNTANSKDEAYDQYQGRLGAQVALPWEVRFRLSGKLSRKYYENKDSLFGIKREDTRWEVGGTLSRPIYWQWLSLIAEYRFIHNDSNIEDEATGVDLFDYDRHQATLSVAVSF